MKDCTACRRAREYPSDALHLLEQAWSLLRIAREINMNNSVDDHINMAQVNISRVTTNINKRGKYGTRHDITR